MALRLKSGSKCFQPEQELTRLTLSPELLFGLTMTGLPRYIIGPALQMFVSMKLATGIHDYQDKKSRVLTKEERKPMKAESGSIRIAAVPFREVSGNPLGRD